MSSDGPFTTHVILVAFTVTGNSREDAEEYLRDHLPRPDANLEEWWVAEDDRHDGSDNDSAVFVIPGNQEVASRHLWKSDLTPLHNVVERPDSRFEEYAFEEYA